MKKNNLNYQIVVPFYNDFENFKKFIKIIKNINIKKKIFLLVDNGSSSNELVEYSKHNKHQESCWKLIRSEKNLGFGGGVKYGASFVEKDYVAWMPGNLKLNPHDVFIFLEKFQIKEQDFLLKAKRVERPLMDRLKTIIFGLIVSPFIKFNMMDSGGSEVNSGLYFKLTGHYKKKFLEISEINEEEWNTAEKLVENILSVQNSPNLENTKIKSALIEGSKKNDNITFDEVPRWRKYEPLEESQTMQVTYLKKARDLGLKIICNSSVVGIIPGKEYIEINMLKDNSSSTIKTKKVILSAGTVGTPKILKKSGLLKESVSFNFHPMLRCVVDYGEYVNDGDLFPPFMSWTNDYKHKFAYSVSTYPYIKATLAATGHYDMNINPQNFASYYSSTVFEESKGKILYFKNKSFPFIYVKKKDRKKIKEGFVLLKKILNDGGIKELWPKSDFSPMTAVHIFGSLPLNMSKNIGKNGELNSDSRIKICDASLLPIAPWGNTQAVVMVLNEILMDRWIKQIAKES